MSRRPTDRLLADLATAATELPQVTGAVAVMRRQARIRDAAPLPGGGEQRQSGCQRDGRPRAELSGGPVPFPPDAPATLPQALHRAADAYGTRGTTYLTPDGREEHQSYAELLAEARHVLGGLRSAGLGAGDSALFQFSGNRTFVTTFWACVLGGIIPTPVAMAPSYDRHSAVSRKLRNAWRLLDRPVLLTGRTDLPAVSELGRLWDETGVRVLATEDLAASTPATDPHPAAAGEPVLQLLTSGSTGVPKCVRHTHHSIAARTYGVAHANGYGPDGITMNWMPLDHVAIAMYNVRDVFLGRRHVNATVTMFLQDPLNWLTWIDRYRATNAFGPNFAYALVNERAADVALGSWDLSRMRAMDNGGEPVIHRTARRFLEILEPHGLAADAVKPAWGMSETCSGVTYSTLDRAQPRTGAVAVAPDSLTGDIRATGLDDPGALVFAGVGRPVPGLDLRIVDERDEVLPEDRIGRLQVRGEVMMRGYHGNAQADAESRSAGGWFRTGDLAFVHDGVLLITGRHQDQIIVRGANFLAHEIEAALAQVPGVEVAHVAVAGVPDSDGEPDKVAVFFVRSDSGPDPVAAIRAKLVRDVGFTPDFVVPMAKEEFPKTSSGKIQRGQLVAELRAGTFDDRLHATTAEPDLLFERVWERVDAGEEKGAPDGTWLVLDDGWWAEVRPALTMRPSRVIVAGPGAEPARLLADAGPVAAVVFGWNVDTRAKSVTDGIDAGTLPLVSLIQALATGEFGRPLLLAVTRGAVLVDAGDRLNLAAATVPGLIRTAIAEQVLPVVRQVDLPETRDDWPAALSAELADSATTGVVAHRDGTRRISRLRPAAPGERRPSLLRAGGLYLVTGGRGGVGREVARHLLRTYDARLLLIGRTPPAGLEISAHAEYAAIDVADAPALRAAVAAAERRWQRPLAGVLHLAGADVGGYWDRLEEHSLAAETIDNFRGNYQAKVYGTLAIAELLEDRPEAVLILFSSVNGDLGGSSFGAYSSASGFLSGFADHWHHERNRPVRCVAFSAWAGIGMNEGRPTAAAESRGFRPVTAEQGMRLLSAVLTGPRHHALTGLDAGNPRILGEFAAEDLSEAGIVLAYTSAGPVSPEDVRNALLPRFPMPLRILRVAALPTDAHGRIDTVQLLIDTAASPARTDGAAEPLSEAERRLADIWKEVLNRPDVGRDESFFDLGGSSVRAVQLITRINGEMDVDVTLMQLFDNPTVQELTLSLGLR